MLEIRKVSYHYDTHTVLKDISLQVKRNQTVAILGQAALVKQPCLT